MKVDRRQMSLVALAELAVETFLATDVLVTGTVLADASQEGHVGVVEALLAAGANPELADADGETPLHHASYEGHVGVVKALVAAGADATARNQDGGTPLSYARNRGHAAVVAVLEAAAGGR